jgi:hypothetical protein
MVQTQRQDGGIQRKEYEGMGQSIPKIKTHISNMYVNNIRMHTHTHTHIHANTHALLLLPTYCVLEARVGERELDESIEAKEALPLQ